MNTSLRKSERSWSEAGWWGLDGWMKIRLKGEGREGRGKKEKADGK